MSGGVNSRLLADRAMAVADSNQGRISLFVEVDTTGVSKPAAYLLTYHFGAIYTLKIGFFMLFWGLPFIYRSWQPCTLITATPLMTDN